MFAEKRHYFLGKIYIKTSFWFRGLLYAHNFVESRHSLQPPVWLVFILKPRMPTLMFPFNTFSSTPVCRGDKSCCQDNLHSNNPCTNVERMLAASASLAPGISISVATVIVMRSMHSRCQNLNIESSWRFSISQNCV